jgi:hypothetical protein
LFVTDLFNFMDKTILSSAAVFGLEDDTHLVGKRTFDDLLVFLTLTLSGRES